VSDPSQNHFGFHWHVEDLGIRHVYIKPNTPRLNGKVECSHRTIDIDFYQLLSYTGDIDLNQKNSPSGKSFIILLSLVQQRKEKRLTSFLEKSLHDIFFAKRSLMPHIK
jgi:hypothetical protein